MTYHWLCWTRTVVHKASTCQHVCFFASKTRWYSTCRSRVARLAGFITLKPCKKNAHRQHTAENHDDWCNAWPFVLASGLIVSMSARLRTSLSISLCWFRISVLSNPSISKLPLLSSIAEASLLSRVTICIIFLVRVSTIIWHALIMFNRSIALSFIVVGMSLLLIG